MSPVPPWEYWSIPVGVLTRRHCVFYGIHKLNKEYIYGKRIGFPYKKE